ncbi:hypothetical protein MKUB_44630 [Mycobacterium kubicae]|uniref:DUF4397 domain-containing protein n=1 Tax=Mycobacterium kubicae TaxID=120959 RepID=A0AAX1J673_9MYCO|nr:DUF4397 domain-containing protein [Mycobacterium kubicae]MCV7097585.1 DUF4397 domain-containing protein [Mycobacterium kubicae]QNI13461.1 hypothetical protein GAN18_21910 [Mycobacterium kubicae]QPI36979.1 DUF4397 domain-containing protein [Mycobacterium kubicae]GFG66973.1 hypothetical protein MKUB_44630 [Mycobacterium kubicae]
MQTPSEYVTLNSITDNPDMGDERNFFRFKAADDPNAYFSNRIRIAPDHRYTAEVFFENSASPGLASAIDTRVQVLLPSTVKGSAAGSAFVRASNASPPAVWQSSILTLPGPDDAVAIRFVPGTAILHSQGKSNGRQIDIGELVSDSGALVGCDELDGVVPSESRCEGWLTVDFVTDQPRFTVGAWLAAAGSSEYGGNRDIKPGETVTVKMTYENTGTVEQDNVLMTLLSLPRCATVVPGTTWFAADTTDGKWQRSSEDIGPNHPLNVGNYNPHANVYIKFDVQFCDKDQLSQEYNHDWAKGALWTEPYLTVGVSTENGWKTATPFELTILGPNQK